MMHRWTLPAGAAAMALAMASLAPAAQAAGRAEVAFPGSDGYTDIGVDARDREAALHALHSQLERLARRLPDGQVLHVTFEDVDLAGRIVWRRLDPVRVVGEWPDAPRLRFRYEQRDGERVLQAGQAVLTDMAYLRRLGTARAGIALPYEGRLLERWFAERIAPAH